MNGLVYEWLAKLGLAEVAPTFEAAGIVAPKHLATLDVSYFESLGVTNPEQRRKLFYLCQRIKLAMEKNGRSLGDDTEECVDAVISESFTARKEENGDEDHEAINEEKKTDAKPSAAFESFNSLERRRRSKRLALKLAEEKSQETMGTTTGTTVSNTSKTSTRNTNAIASTSTTNTKRKSIASVSTAANRATSPVKSPVKQRPIAASRVGKNKENPPVKETTPTKNVFNLDGDDESLSHPKTAPDGERVYMEVGSTVQSSLTKMHQPDQNVRRRQGPASKLPGSIRTGKPLSAIPSELAAPPSPLVEFSSSHLNEEMENTNQIIKKDFASKLSRGKTATKSKRRTTLSAGDNDELEDLLQSSASESSAGGKLKDVLFDASDSDTESNVSGGRPRMPSLNKNRSAKSMSASDSAHLKQHQARQQIPRRTSTTTNLAARSNLDRRQSSSVLSRSDSTSVQSTAASSGPIIQGMSEGTSWAAQINNLREDNDDEYELFCDQMNSEEPEYFDMRIKVIVRKRPMSKSESTSGLDIIHPLDYNDFGKILVYQPRTRVDLTKEVETVPFAFDNVYGETSTNIQIYERSIRNLVRPFFDGQWATCFAYGQTGSGKTYTMMGSNITGINAGTATNDDSNLGLYYLAALEVFEILEEPQYDHLSVHVSLFEIYGGGKLFDLLNERKQIKCLEDSNGKVCFPGLTQHPVTSPQHVMDLIEQGAGNRSTGTTSRNADSSRSHAVLQIKLIKKVGRNPNVEHSRFSFIDLAGSERGADTNNADKATRLEGADINTSLLALKEVIRALATGDSMKHIPFRGSKLTQVLKDSFVGDNARCCMVACISPDIGNCEQTLNTLRYADRVKERDPETGALSSSCQQPTRLAATEASKIVASPTESSAIATPPSRVQIPTKKSRFPATPKQKAGTRLVSNHRKVTETWLEMLQDETELLQAANDENGWHVYMSELQNLQLTQLDFIDKLRGSLQAYIDERAPENRAEISFGSGAVSDEESFEDLRD
ncbi:kinesin motor domain containing protein [Nitzschia inconspicua]|uniref:Kinesin motor domain containing protein n=1 Tax=Nitzschia inconspicua TaxID=303405 RepID=A0A9K3L5U5_9STRA|nr:kinesin motor domain containing protein [Nitzschia inconspicua]